MSRTESWFINWKSPHALRSSPSSSEIIMNILKIPASILFGIPNIGEMKFKANA